MFCHRPQYHFQPPSNWMNDPNGLIEWKGRYHLFYQYNPDEPVWGNIHWGHATSPDLIYWDHLPVALAPAPDGPDRSGCFSGCCVSKDGKPVIVYTGFDEKNDSQLPCLATGNDDLTVWTKHPDNPVIKKPPPLENLAGFRDHCVWKEGEDWLQLIGSGVKGKDGNTLLFRSKDLIDWDYCGIAFAQEISLGGNNKMSSLKTDMWECPDLFQLGEKHILIISADKPLRKSLYFVGSFRNGRFKPEHMGLLDPGKFYAPQTFKTSRGERVMFGWIPEGVNDDHARKQGWAGMLTLPRVISLDADSNLTVGPSAQTTLLRKRSRRLADTDRPLTVKSNQQMSLEAAGDQCEIRIRLSAPPGVRFSTGVLAQDTDAAAITIEFRDKESIEVSISNGRQESDCSASLPPSDREHVELTIFVDHSVIEVFTGTALTLTERVYPEENARPEIRLHSENGETTVDYLEVWTLKSIW